MNQPWIIPAALSTTMTVTADQGGLGGLVLAERSGPHLTVEAHFTNEWGDTDWHPAPAPFSLEPGDQVRLTRTVTDAEASILNVFDASGLLSSLTVPGPGRYAVRLEPDEYRFLTLALPDGANGLHVQLQGGRGDIDLRVTHESGAVQSRYTGSLTGNKEATFTLQAAAGTYTIRLNEARERPASAWLVVSYDPAGPLPAYSTLTTTAEPQGLTLPEGMTMLSFGLDSGSVQVSWDAGTSWVTRPAPFTSLATPEEAPNLRFKTATAPATVNYLPYVPGG